MDDRRARGKRLFRRERRQQFFVFDFDQQRRRARLLLVLGRHRGDRLADVAHLALRNRVLVLDQRAHQRVRAIFARDDCMHARRRERRRDVIAHDFCVRVRTWEYGARQHAGKRHVGNVFGTAGRLLHGIEAGKAAPDGDLFAMHLRGAATAHGASSAAACATAATILR